MVGFGVIGGGVIFSGICCERPGFWGWFSLIDRGVWRGMALSAWWEQAEIARRAGSKKRIMLKRA